MKKLPIFLTALALMGGVNVGAMSLANAKAGVRLFTVEPLTKSLELATNYYDQRASIAYLSPAEEMVWVRARLKGSNADILLKRVVLVHQDFENGVTDEEADEKAKTLGEVTHDDWAKTLADQDYEIESGMRNTNMNMLIDMDQSGTSLKENYRDVIYFAFEFQKNAARTETGWTGETIWVRGKIDYRSCIHNAQYEENSWAGRCYVDDDDSLKGAGQSFYTLMNVANLESNDYILSWEEEWQQILAERERVEQEKLEAERLEQEKLEAEKLAQEEAARLEQERLEELAKAEAEAKTEVDPAAPVKVKEEYMTANVWVRSEVENATEVAQVATEPEAEEEPKAVETPVLGVMEETETEEAGGFSWWWVVILATLGLGTAIWWLFLVWRRKDEEL